MNWSHFKPVYSSKPEEDVKAHLLRTNDWMNTQARLWYASLEPIAMTWPELHNQFRRQYSKLGNTGEHSMNGDHFIMMKM